MSSVLTLARHSSKRPCVSGTTPEEQRTQSASSWQATASVGQSARASCETELVVCASTRGSRTVAGAMMMMMANSQAGTGASSRARRPSGAMDLCFDGAMCIFVLVWSFGCGEDAPTARTPTLVKHSSCGLARTARAQVWNTKRRPRCREELLATKGQGQHGGRRKM